jgi:ubiquinone/menaquinone biosynthesis C-methylase UbiE
MGAAKFWSEYAEKYEKSSIDDLPAYEYTLERTKSYLSESDAVLELGAGTGSTAILLAPHVARITASDFADGMMKIAARKASAAGVENMDTLTADAFDPRLEGRRFDAVLAFNLLHLVPNMPDVVQRAFELTRPGGLFISKTSCAPTGVPPFSYALMMYVAVPLMQLLGKAPEVHMTSIKVLQDAVAAAGFEVIEEGDYPAKPPRRYIVARRPL